MFDNIKDIKIKGKHYSIYELRVLCNEKDTNPQVPIWEKEIYSFVKDWVSSSDSIDVTTSGSTGFPKDISLQKKHMIASAKATLSFFKLKKDDTAWLCLPVKYIAGKMMIVRAMVGGLDLVYSEPTSMPTIDIKQKVDLAAMLHSLCDDLGDSGTSIEYEGPERFTYSCRPLSLQRALANLLNNAVGYGEAAQVSLVSNDTGVCIEVCDRGPGIPEHSQERVFEPFVRLDSARSRSTGGTGLGLPIARSVVHAHGGTISLANRQAGGLVVTIVLPT